MAITLVGAPVTTTYASRTNTAINAPAGLADGDFMVVWILTGLSSASPTVTPPAGWTQLTNTNGSSGGFNVKSWTFIKFASSEPASWTWTHTAASSQGAVLAYRGVDTSTPIDVTSTTNVGVGSTTTWLGLTTVTDGAMIVALEMDWGNNTNNTVVPTGTTPTFTERYDLVLSYACDGIMTTAGATGNKTHTNNANTDAWQAHLLALRPAGAGSNTGTLSASVPRATSTLAASATDPGAVAASVPRATSSLSGTATDPGALSAALPRATASLAGNSINPGSMSPALPRVTSSAAATATNPGSLAAATRSLTSLITGSSGDAAALAVTLPVLSASLSGTQVNSGTMNASTRLLSAVMDGSEIQPIEGELSADLPAVSTSLVGESRNSGSLTALVSPVSASVQGTQVNSGSMSAVAIPLVIVVGGTALHSGDVAANTPLLMSSIDGVMVNSGEFSGALFLPQIDLSGDSVISGSMDVQMPALDFFMEDLGARRDVTILSVVEVVGRSIVVAEVPVRAVTVVEVVQPVVIQEVSA